MKEALQGLLDDIIRFGWNLLLAIIILVVGFNIIKIIMNKVKKGKGFNKLEKSSQTFLTSIISMGLKIVVVIMAILVAVAVPICNNFRNIYGIHNYNNWFCGACAWTCSSRRFK